MKKVIGIFMIMVFAFLLITTNVIAEECDCKYCKTERLVRAYSLKNGYENCGNDLCKDNIHYYTGVIVSEDWKDIYGEEFTIEAWAEWACNEFNIVEMTIQELETINGNTIYYTEAETADEQFKCEPEGVQIVKVIFTVIDTQY